MPPWGHGYTALYLLEISSQPLIIERMTTRLTPDQEALVAGAIAKGLAPSAEEFVSEALRNQVEQSTYAAELDTWLRDEVVTGHDEYMVDPSRAVPAGDVLAAIKSRRKADTSAQ